MHEHETDSEGRQICTTSGEKPSVTRQKQYEQGDTGQHDSYVVLCEEERKKGFVRPYRESYIHTGEEQQLVDDAGLDSHKVRTGGCGKLTRMGRALSETYARDPGFYSHTFCAYCNRHFPVSEFIWAVDDTQLGS